jgi:hypothetical protein
MYALPTGLMILYCLSQNRREFRSLSPSPPIERGARGEVTYILLAALFFILFSAPWWVFDFTHNHAALSTYLTNSQTGEFEGIGIPYVPPSQRALGLVFIGLPTLLGLKFPWEASYFFLPLGGVVLLIHSIAIICLLRGHNPLKPHARGLVLGMIALFCLIFVASTFGADPTGRYFVVLALPFGIVLGTLVDSVNPHPQPFPRQQGKGETQRSPSFLPFSVYGGWGWILLALVLIYHAAGQITAATSPTGLTTQFDLVSHVPNNHDADLIALLDEEEIQHGYTNYWVAFRLAFLSGERMQFSAALPYKRDLSYNPADNRYPPYDEAIAQAERIAYITTNLPELDAWLEEDWAAQGITYEETQVGVFHVYYDFRPSAPHLSTTA